MFRIGEFSRLTRVSVRMLRYYDEMGLLKPAWVEEGSGYRLYSAEQIRVLNRIVYLRDSGFQVAEIRTALFSDGTKGRLEDLLNAKYREIESVIRAEQEKLRKIEIAKAEILGEGTELHYQIQIKSIPSYPVLSLRRVLADYYCEGDLWQEVARFVAQRQIRVLGDSFSIYHDLDYRETEVDVELCVPVEALGVDEEGFIFWYTEPVPDMASMMVYGDFSNISGAFAAFATWLEAHDGFRMSGLTRQIVHRGPWNEESSENYLTELQIPVDSHIM